MLLIIKNFSLYYPGLITWGVTGVLLVLVFTTQKEWIDEYVSEWKLNRLLKNIGYSSLHNVVISDDLDGQIFIENLILTKNKILLLGVKKYRGLIFAADKIDYWTQVLNNKSYKFENPLRQLESDALTLNSKIESSKIEEKVLFIKGSEFPKGKPDNVIVISELKKMNENYNADDISEDLHTDWEHLLELATNNTLEKGVLIDRNRTSGLKVFSLITLLTAILFWLLWRLM